MCIRYKSSTIYSVYDLLASFRDKFFKRNARLANQEKAEIYR